MSGKKESKKIEDEILDETAEPEEVVQEKEQEKEDDQDTKYLRLMADFQNYKRRNAQEKSEIYSYANEKIISELLAVMDNFERALSHETDVSESYAEGMNLIFKNFKEILDRAGLSEIEALGTDFDPNFHNAVLTEAGSGYESGKISAVIQKGYKLNNKVIRPSMVKVAE